MRQFYTLYEQIIDVSEENKAKEIETFTEKYHLDFKRSHNPPQAKPIWEFFAILILINTIINYNTNYLLTGYAGIAALYVCAFIIAKYHVFNIKVN